MDAIISNGARSEGLLAAENVLAAEYVSGKIDVGLLSGIVRQCSGRPIGGWQDLDSRVSADKVSSAPAISVTACDGEFERHDIVTI